MCAVCIYSYSHEDIHTKSLSFFIYIYIYLSICIICILLKHHSDISCSQPTKESSFSFLWIFVRFKVFQWTARFCEKKVKAFKAGKLRSMKVSCANCALGGVRTVSVGFSIFGGILPQLRIPIIWGISKTTNNQQLTIF